MSLSSSDGRLPIAECPRIERNLVRQGDKKQMALQWRQRLRHRIDLDVLFGSQAAERHDNIEPLGATGCIDLPQGVEAAGSGKKVWRV